MLANGEDKEDQQTQGCVMIQSWMEVVSCCMSSGAKEGAAGGLALHRIEFN